MAVKLSVKLSVSVLTRSLSHCWHAPLSNETPATSLVEHTVLVQIHSVYM